MASPSGESGEENRGRMWEIERAIDHPMDAEAGQLRNMHQQKAVSLVLLLQCAFQSLGVVFGDLATSPLYVFANVFPRGIDDTEEVIGALSLIIYSLTLVPLLKYIFVVLRANDNGQGGTFALYSLLCRHAKISLVPNQHRTDEELTTYSRRTYDDGSVACKFKNWLEGHSFQKSAILILVLVGASMAIGDGILTPAISVLSASGGIQAEGGPNMSNGIVVLVSVIILVGIFSMQHYGTNRVGWLFAPIVFLWLIMIGVVGAMNIFRYDRSVVKAYNPVYIYRYFKRGKADSWASLGGVLLSITGTEAMFADLSHFPLRSIQMAFTLVVFPCLLLQYTGQAAYIAENQDHVYYAFYFSLPVSVFWPAFVVATAAAIVASQATISATYTIIKQAHALGCFPRVKVVHTSENFLGQIYIPEINWILMILCTVVTFGFKNQQQIANAYGTAVVTVMLVTTFMMVPIMLLVWRTHWILVIAFTLLSLAVEAPYFSAVMLKIDQGGFVPLVMAGVLFIAMYVWHYGTVKRYEVEVQSRVPMSWILGLGPSLGLVRVPGIGLVYTELASGVPSMFSHFVTNLPAIHTVVIMVCIKYLPVYTVPAEERYLVRRIGPRGLHMFRCVARYGYKDIHRKDDGFEQALFNSLLLFVRLEALAAPSRDSALESDSEEEQAAPAEGEVEEEVEYLWRSREAGVVHLLGNTVVRARRGSSLVKRVAIDYVYAFLRRASRESSVVFNVPHESLLNVGQIFYV